MILGWEMEIMLFLASNWSKQDPQHPSLPGTDQETRGTKKPGKCLNPFWWLQFEYLLLFNTLPSFMTSWRNHRQSLVGESLKLMWVLDYRPSFIPFTDRWTTKRRNKSNNISPWFEARSSLDCSRDTKSGRKYIEPFHLITVEWRWSFRSRRISW